MATSKTTATDEPIDAYLARIKTDAQRADARALIDLLTDATGEHPVMWGTSIVGFGTHSYVHDSGRSGTTAAVGFAARSGKLVIYGTVMGQGNDDLFDRLGPHTTGVGCLNIKRLSDVDRDALHELAARAHRARANV